MRLKTKEEIQQRSQAQKRARVYQIIRDGRIAIVYARQSAKDQPVKNKQAKAMQTDDLLDLAEEYEISRDDVLIFVENYYDAYGEYDPSSKPRNASGNLRIDKRPGLQHIMHMVEQDKVSAIFVREVSRLFRDETHVGPPMFADSCKRHQTVIITPSYVYDFNAVKRNDLDRFLEEARIAAAYLKNMREIAHAAKYRKGTRGKYSGHAVPTGFMLDDDREGYVPNPLWSPIVSDITHRFHVLGGDLAALRREVMGKCVFPDLPPDIATRVGKVYLEKVGGGYTIKSRYGLIHILTNPANIGHFVFDGQIVRRNAHDSIVDKDDFLFALHQLCDVDLDGNPINRPERAVRIPQRATVNPRDGLLAGVRSNGRPVLTTDQGYVYLFQLADEKDGAYVIKNGADMSLGQYTGSLSVKTLDSVFEERLLKRLDDLFDLAARKKQRTPPMVYEDKESQTIADELTGMFHQREDDAAIVVEHFHAIRQDVMKSLAGVPGSIAELKRQIAVLKNDLARDRAMPFMDELDREDCYAALKNLRADLASLERKNDDAAKTLAAIEDTGKKILQGREYWSKMTTDQKKTFVRLVTHDIHLHDTGIGFMEATVTWVALMGDPLTERAYIQVQNGSSANWTEDEERFLQQYYPTAGREEIIHMLTRRSWRSIVIKASRMGIARHTRAWDTLTISQHISLDMHNYMQENGLGGDGRVFWRTVSPIKDRSRGLLDSLLDIQQGLTLLFAA